MKKMRIILFLAGICIFLKCSDMNDKHDIYLSEGERIYIGKIDSLNIYPGKNRVKLEYWVTDPRIQTVVFKWMPFNDSLVMRLERTASTDSFEVFLGENNSLNEGNYTLTTVAKDNKGNTSIAAQKTFRVYGEQYNSSLADRILRSVEYNEDTGLELDYSSIIYEDNVGIELTYTNLNNKSISLLLSNEQLSNSIIISDIDVSHGASYKTVYAPQGMSVDSFYTASKKINIYSIENVALNKPVRVSAHSGSNEGKYAVDGVISHASRWLSPASGEHWIEIDLLEDYSIFSFKTIMGSLGNINFPVPNFIFQAEVDGDWIDVVEIKGNTDPEHSISFPEVTTRKVRYFVPNYSGNQVRLYEIYVYTRIEY